MIFYRTSELMLPTLIQTYDKKKTFIFHPVQKSWDELKFYKLPNATFYDRINTIYQFIKPFLDKKIVYFWVYGALNLI